MHFAGTGVGWQYSRHVGDMANYTYNLGLAFAGIAARQPERPALRMVDGGIVCFQALNDLGNAAAACLRDHGVHRHDVVAVVNAKTPAGYAILLGCLKLGAAYVHLDDHNPPQRLERILTAARPRLLACDRALPGSVAAVARKAGLPVLDLDRQDLRANPGEPQEMALVTGADPAYLMFTSGSTGFPKGAVMSHANVLNFISWTRARFGITPSDILTNVNPVYFDNSVFDIYGSLWNGASLAPISRELTKDARALVKAVGALGCTVWFSVPSMLIFLTAMRAIGTEDLPTIRAFVFGGEGYPKPELKKLYDRFRGQSRFINVYGPTECTCICSAYDVTDADFADMRGLLPLGDVCENFSKLVLDEANRPVAANTPGELCLLGPNVGLGYYGDPERTAASFVQNPMHVRYPERMYHTGDLVRLDEHGVMWFVGRRDNQIKHMGYRIELEEIESALAGLPYVVQAAAVYQRHRPNHGHIVAFVASADCPDENRVRNDLKTALPTYMLPDRVIVVSELPKNANGKVDRARLTTEKVP